MDFYHSLDLFGTAIFAYTGAHAAKKQNFHVIGVFYLAVLTAVGGGTLRAFAMQEPTLFWIASPDYLLVISLTVLHSYLPSGQLNIQRTPFYVLDCISLAVFVSIGFSLTLAQSQTVYIAITMGILTGIGGSSIRDAITSQRPQALVDPLYPLMLITSIIGCVISDDIGWEPWTIAVPGVLLAVLWSPTFARLKGQVKSQG